VKYKKIKEKSWINTKTNEIFVTNTFKDKHGKRFNFLDTKTNFVSGKYGLEYYKNFSHRTGIINSDFNISDEFISSKSLKHNCFKNKKVLILGGGPSSMKIDWKNNYDCILTCNNYYKKFNIDPFLITFTPYMPLLDEDLQEFLDKTKCLIGLEPEFHKSYEEKKVFEFWRKYKNRTVVYHTRYCSALGASARQAVLAVLLGASEVHLCGMDLFKNNDSKTHSFEDYKDLPRWRKMYGIEFQNRQVIAFWEYINEIAKEKKCKIKNIAENLECNSMSFITKVANE
tara:strand:+ start:132 stop:986 length:855 start_codon:yes stop_codon:yes gene_type:complete